jgi:hypothetical protein
MPFWKVQSSYAGMSWFNEQMSHILNIAGDSNKLDLTILPGVGRTGTSVLFQCLHATDGFQEKNKSRLVGFPPTEHILFRVANNIIARYLGATALMPGSDWDKEFGDLLVGSIDNSKELDFDTKYEMRTLVGILIWQEVKLLKEPTCQFALQCWINNYDCFKNAKYIWTRRNIRETAKSYVRLKVPDRLVKGKYKPTGYRGNLTVGIAEKIVTETERLLEGIMPQVNHIEVWHHDLINDTKNTFDRISEFVGAEVNTDAFDRGKMYGKV